MKKILITGCSGSLGARLCGYFLGCGFEVVGFDVASAPSFSEDSGHFRYVQDDITSLAGLRQAALGTEWAVHCAALLPNSTHLGRNAFLAVNTRGSENFLRACVSEGVQKAVVITNTGVLKPGRTNEVVNDDAGYRDTRSYYLESKILAEQGIDALDVAGKINYLILRPAAIYGPGMLYKWTDIFKMAKKNRLFVIGRGLGQYSFIHVDDLIEAVHAALEKLSPNISGRKVSIVSSRPHTMLELFELIGRCFCSKPPFRVPYSVAMAGAFSCQVASKLIPSELLSSVTVDSIQDLKRGQVFDPSRAERLIGFQAKRRLEDEMPKIIAEYRGLA